MFLRPGVINPWAEGLGSRLRLAGARRARPPRVRVLGLDSGSLALAGLDHRGCASWVSTPARWRSPGSTTEGARLGSRLRLAGVRRARPPRGRWGVLGLDSGSLAFAGLDHRGC